MKRLAYYFFQGLLFLVPVGLTFWVVGGVFVMVDRMQGLLGIDVDAQVPGLGVAIMLLLVTGIGFLASNFVTRRALLLFDSVLERLPFIKLLYSAVKDLMNAFVGEGKKFKKPVLVDLVPGGHVRVLGFVTRESLENLGFAESVGVYLPQAYNFAGQLVVVPRTAVHPVPQDSGEVMAFIVSGGITGRETRNIPIVRD
jgi:uncharacterized membrane protein